jgi:hypothetical protein
MATIQSQLVCDNSTLNNFKQWGHALSSAFGTFGWSQSSDTGQVNWSTIGSVPGSGAFVYEIWEPNDGLPNFFLKIEYGNGSSTNSPTVQITLSTTTNGAGTATGVIIGPFIGCGVSSSFTAPSASTQYECDFSGVAGRFAAMLWRNAPSSGTITNPQQLFAVERSVDATGAYTSDHVTLVMVGSCPLANATFSRTNQQSIVFGVGASPAIPPTPTTGINALGGCLSPRVMLTGSSNFNGSLAFDTVAPMVGFWDFPLTVLGVANGPDLVEGVTFSASMYGSTRTYMPSKNGPFASVVPGSNAGAVAVCMRYD